MPPDIHYREQDGKFHVMRQPPKLKNIVFRGGGGKGIGNAPALIEMQDAHYLDGLEQVVGSSAGALTALCLASGNDAHDFKKIADTTSMTSLLTTPWGFSKRYPNVAFGKAGANGGKAIEVADRNTAGKVGDYLQDQMKNNRVAFEKKVQQLVDAEEKLKPGSGKAVVERLMKLSNQDFAKNRTDQMVTFNDLRLLSQLEPSKFRQLTLTGWDATNKEGTYFNATNSPDMPIAIAGRISMAIPPAFAQVKYDPGDKKGIRNFADGGIGSNMPSEAVTRTNVNDPSSELTGKERQGVIMRTAVMTFDDGGSKAQAPKPSLFQRIKAKFTGKEPEVKQPELKGAYQAIHGSDEANKKNKAGFFKRKFSGNEEIHITSQRDQQKISEFGLNAFVVAHDGMGTFGFIGATKGKIATAENSASKLMKEQISLREGQVMDMDYASVKDAFDDLSPREKQDMLRQPHPDARNFENGVHNKEFQAKMDLYNLVLQERNANRKNEGKGVKLEEHDTSVRESLGKGKDLKDNEIDLSESVDLNKVGTVREKVGEHKEEKVSESNTIKFGN